MFFQKLGSPTIVKSRKVRDTSENSLDCDCPAGKANMTSYRRLDLNQHVSIGLHFPNQKQGQTISPWGPYLD